MLQQRCILIIDDEIDYLELLRLRLESEGFAVATATSGRGGIEKAKEISPNIILLDITMPDMDGFEVCSELRIDNSTKQIPIIMLTAKTGQFDRKFAKGVGANDYITKPFDARDLMAKITRLIY